MVQPCCYRQRRSRRIRLSDSHKPASIPVRPNAPSQTPAFAGQTDAPEARKNVAFDVVTAAEGLDKPWGLAILPSGKMLVTEKPGRLRVVAKDGTLSPAVTGLPPVDARGQGGLLDVLLDRQFASNQLIYWSYSEPAENQMNNTAVARGKFVDGAEPRVENVQVIYHQAPSWNSVQHYGSRLVWHRDGTLFVTQGDRSVISGRMQSQQMDSLIGKIVRINADGTIPKDNPFVGKEGVRPGDLVDRPSQRPGRDAASHRPASSGKSSTGRAAATSSTSRARARTTAGRRSPTGSNTRARRSPGTSRRKRAWNSRSTTGIPSSRRAA